VHDYPAPLVRINHVEPVPRRIRATLAGATVLDTTRALYVWEWSFYPQYYIPVDDVRRGVLVPEGVVRPTPRGDGEVHAVVVGDTTRPGAALVLEEPSIEALRRCVRFEWSALDGWFEEDERVFVHPRNPYVRVDALRSTRSVRIERDGVTLGESFSPVMVFETGLPTRYYLNRTEVDFTHLVPTDTVTSCPYKGTTSGYWSLSIGGTLRPDVAWAYDFPTRQLLPIAGMIAFYNEKVDIVLDGRRLDRPRTHFSGPDN
jgi:uncharacterized protein (DUF427 family)